MTDKVKATIKCFVEAVINVLGTMAMVQVKPGQAYLKKDDKAKGDITGVIGMSSPSGKAKGTMSITFTEQSALGIVSNMLGEQFTEINQDVIDAVGEMTNMICGQARKNLVEIGMQFDGAIPSVVTGKDHSISHVSSKAILAIPFTTQFGNLTVEVCFS